MQNSPFSQIFIEADKTEGCSGSDSFNVMIHESTEADIFYYLTYRLQYNWCDSRPIGDERINQ